MQADILREKFLAFFKARRHRIVESDSLVPKDDPTVLFTPAGMNQFKRQFMGIDCRFKRAATSQRCLRTDDLEKVGKTAVHHTFFEMLGNFSFGDYFKKEAIQWAWEFLTQELKIDKQLLWVSVYREDDEAYAIWRDIVGVPEKKIVRLGDKENFWPAEAKVKGPNGPCGPCSEIFYDFGAAAGCGKANCSPACDCGRFAEIWNLVFTQFNRKENGALEPLPNKNIDTGMGLERLAAVMQGKQNNFETDLFEPIIKSILSTIDYRLSTRLDIIYAIADHIRAVTFAIFDGVVPSNEGRGYVVRKILRKAILYARALGSKKPFVYTLVAPVAQAMRKPYPELLKRQEEIAALVLAEEKNFLATLESSAGLFADKFAGSPDASAAARTAFQLYDTYGIPLELTKDWLEKQKIEFSQSTFDAELEAQKNRSKLTSAMKGDVFASSGAGAKLKPTKFSGYKELKSRARVVEVLRDKGADKLVLDSTPFYAESGGQVGDTGIISKGKAVFEVQDTQSLGKVIVHIGQFRHGSFKKGSPVTAQVDSLRRQAIARNHTATHLLQAALRKVLGEHVKQQGSLVEPERLRFDFTHFKALSKDELAKVEDEVNSHILSNRPLELKSMSLSAAKNSGALAFFAEKYEGKVRVVNVWGVSKELCGGTHVPATGTIGTFKIIQEGSVASGVRRIEAVTGERAYRIIKDEERALTEVTALLRVSPDKAAAEIEKKLILIKELEKKLNLATFESCRSSLDGWIAQAEDFKGIKMIVKFQENLSIDLLRGNVDLIKQKVNNTLIALGTSVAGRAILVVALTSDLCAKGMDAVKIIREAAKEIGGSGGGRPDFAQAGGSSPQNFDAAFKKIKELI